MCHSSESSNYNSLLGDWGGAKAILAFYTPPFSETTGAIETRFAPEFDVYLCHKMEICYFYHSPWWIEILKIY